MTYLKKNQSTTNKLKSWFILVINIYQHLPIPNTRLLSEILTIIYMSNGEIDNICMEILSRGLLKTKKSIQTYLLFMQRINLLKRLGKNIQITDKYLPK